MCMIINGTIVCHTTKEYVAMSELTNPMMLLIVLIASILLAICIYCYFKARKQYKEKTQ